VSGDPIADYLAELRAGLRTAPARTAEIAAEAEDHLRESAAARRAAGLDEAAAQVAAIAAFGPVRQVTGAHRPTASAYAAAAGWRAWPLLAGYLMLSALIGGLLVRDETARAHGHVMTAFTYRARPGGQPMTYFMDTGRLDAGQLAAVFGGCALAGLLLLAGFLAARRRRGPGAGPVPLPRAVFLLAAATGLLAFATVEDRGTANYALAWLTRVTGAYELFEGTLYAAVVLGAGCALGALVSFSLAQTGVRPRDPAVAGHSTGLAAAVPLAASAAPGPARRSARARRTPVHALAVAAGFTAWSLLARYLLLSALLGGVLLYLDAGVSPGLLSILSGGVVLYVNGQPPPAALPDPGPAAASFGGCVLAGLLLLAGYLIARRRRLESGLAPARLPRGLSLLVAATGLTFLGLAEYWFFRGDVMGQLHVADGIACLILGSQWAAVLTGAGYVLRAVAILVRWTVAGGRGGGRRIRPEDSTLAHVR
jgi:hypothetical protein